MLMMVMGGDGERIVMTVLGMTNDADWDSGVDHRYRRYVG